MMSALTSSAFTSATTCPKLRGIRPLQFHESRVLSYIKSNRCNQIVSSSLQHNLGNIDASRENPFSKNSVSPMLKSVDAFIQEKETFVYPWPNIAKKLSAAYMFIRPYQIYGAILGIVSVSLIPVQSLSDLSPTFFFRLLKTIIPVVLVYVHMNGLNEIADVEIDKINKPFLPLVSGDLSLTEATTIISISTVVSFLIAASMNSLPLTLAIMIIFFMGNAYSIDLPLLRWKNSAILTATIIIGLWTFVTPLLFFAHAQKYILGRPIMYTKPVFFTMAVVASFTTVFSVLKDVPDVKGDKEHGVKSASIIYGVEKVFGSCVYLLLATYGGAAIFGATSTLLPTKIIGVLGHVIPAIILWTRAKSTDVSDPKATLSFYMLTYKLLYAEFLLIPFIR